MCNFAIDCTRKEGLRKSGGTGVERNMPASACCSWLAKHLHTVKYLFRYSTTNGEFKVLLSTASYAKPPLLVLQPRARLGLLHGFITEFFWCDVLSPTPNLIWPAPFNLSGLGRLTSSLCLLQ
jgi:hypothetical protein